MSSASARINIALDIEKNGAKKKKELPFKILCMGQFSGHKKQSELSLRPAITVNPRRFDEALKAVSPTLNISTSDNEKLTLSFESLQDFSPDQIIFQVPQLRKYLAMRQLLLELKTKTRKRLS